MMMVMERWLIDPLLLLLLNIFWLLANFLCVKGNVIISPSSSSPFQFYVL